LHRSILIAPFIFLLTFAGAGNAANLTHETWQVTWPGQSCTLVLSYDKATMSGKVTVKRPCGRTLRKVKSFVYTDGRKSEMILFRRPGARGAVLGNFSKQGRNRMQGGIGDGIGASMFMSQSSSVTTNSSANITLGGITLGGITLGGAPAGSASADCVLYSDRSGCAGRADLKNPKVPTFDKISMRALSKLKIYPFSGGNGFAKSEVVARNACVKVKKCESSFGGKGDWCQVVLSDGFFTGWVKRQDEDFVYLQKGC